MRVQTKRVGVEKILEDANGIRKSANRLRRNAARMSTAFRGHEMPRREANPEEPTLGLSRASLHRVDRLVVHEIGC